MLTPTAMALLTFVPLAAYLGGLSYAIFKRPTHPDPHDRMARGCLMLLTLPAMALAALVLIGLAMGAAGLVRWTFYLVIGLTAWVALSFAATALKRSRRRRVE